MSNFISPSFQLNAFHCPHCSVLAKMYWSQLVIHQYGSNYSNTPVWISKCTHCDKTCFWIDQVTKGKVSGKLIYPEVSIAPIPHPNMPQDVERDFLEARGIVSKSPKGASALLRLAIQKLCIHLGEPGKNINEDIGSLVKKGLPIEIQQALDIVRVVGNNAVHPGELSNEDVSEIAILLFDLVNEVVEDRIAKPAKLKALFDRLPQGAKNSIEKRDGFK